MKKSLITLAVASVVAAPAAMAAEAVLYGQANASFDMVNNGSISTNKVSSNASRIGFKGSEDLGSGTSAIWQIESGAPIDDGASAANGIGSRPSFVGLSGESWGSLVLGHVDSPAKVATNRFDLFKDTRGDSKKLVTYLDSNNAAIYSSPSMNGFQFRAAIGAAAELATTAGQAKGSIYAMAVTYDAGPLKASLAYDHTKYGATGTGDAAGTAGATLSYTTAGVGYTIDALSGNLVYQRKSDSLNTASRNNWMVNGKYSFGSDAVKLQYVKAGDAGSVANTGAKQVAVGYDHNMSKTTTLYALYTKVNNDSLTKSYVFDGSNALVTNGDDPSGWSVGIKHSF